LPYAEHGFKKALIGLIFGFCVSIIVNSFLSTFFSETGTTMVGLINVFSVIIGLTQLERAKYWSLSYIMGYFSGLFFFGGYFMQEWELLLYLVVIGGYMIQKLLRKADL
jgi:hypothetical protein